ncbi:putative Retrotransposon hot spot protein [Trypanosoma vivax]|nr:putative Retrotransposon hot spot protein [Trypanosoma vivax]
MGPFLLYQLLHCSPDTIGAVLYVVGNCGYVFFKLGSRAGTVKKYHYVCDALAVVNELSDEGVQGCAIYDSSKLENVTNLPIGTWDVVVFNAPDEEVFYKIEEQTIVSYILLNGYNRRELMAAHVWNGTCYSAAIGLVFFRHGAPRIGQRSSLVRRLLDPSRVIYMMEIPRITCAHLYFHV